MYGHRHRPIKMERAPHTQARSTQHAHSAQAMHARRSYVHGRMNANDERTTGYQHRVRLRYAATQLHDPAIRQRPRSFVLHPRRTTRVDVSPRPNDPHRHAASPQTRTCNNHAHMMCPCPTPASSVLTHAFRLHSSTFRPVPTCCGHYLSPSSCIRPCHVSRMPLSHLRRPSSGAHLRITTICSNPSSPSSQAACTLSACAVRLSMTCYLLEPPCSSPPSLAGVLVRRQRPHPASHHHALIRSHHSPVLS